jgi:hypothetical protein
MSEENRIALKVTEEEGIARGSWPLTRGVPFPQGAMADLEGLYLVDSEGQAVATQFRTLSHWSDGSVKWVLVDFQADVAANGEVTYALGYDGGGQNPAAAITLKVDEDDERIVVDTGAVRFAVSRKSFGLVEFAELPGGLRVAGEGDAWVRICEAFGQGVDQRRIYGMGGQCLASLAQDVYKVSVEEAGPLRVVIRCEGAFEADIPMHHYSGYQPFRYVVRLYAYAGQAYLRVLHTVVVACNPQQTEVEEITVHVPAALSGDLRYRIASVRPTQGALAADESLHLAQVVDNHFKLYQHQNNRRQLVAEGERSAGWLAIEDADKGVGVALRYMAEEYPKALEVNGSGNGIDVHLWRHPDGERLNFRRYAEEVAWHDGEGVYSDGLGTAKTSEFFVHFYAAADADNAPDMLRGLLAQPHIAVDPAAHARGQVTGGFAAFDPERFPASERTMTGFADWLERVTHMGHWYGFFDWGDCMVAWDEENGEWRFFGRWGWCNSEWDPRHGMWIQYLRSGEPRYYRLAEAMSRHSMDVDTCHYHPLRPYMVGGCFRHSIDHYGDEVCASHTFIDNWMDYYYLTGDLRTLEVLHETGRFFLRYKWTEDPAFSFSLRSIANTLRGLLYIYEATGEERFKTRAEEVFATIARGQNDDGSWHKRFQVSTPDLLPNQAPYGMASEGTTLAVEMGTAPPFSHDENSTLNNTQGPFTYVLPHDQQKGYQTHYLLIGIELLHRITGRNDVAEIYRRAVDWFCGYPDELNADFAFGQHYGGIICRHLGYAYRLSGDKRYLEIGKVILQKLMNLQNWSDDPKRHGAVLMSPMYLSLFFFGVPYFLDALAEAGIEEPQPD